MATCVTVAIPVYKRLDFLPQALRSVAVQDHPDIDLLVSDNGENGPELEALVRADYPRRFRLRRNPRTVPMTEHFNQLIEHARGEYFMLLADDDYLGEGVISALAAPLDDDPDVRLSLPVTLPVSEDGTSRPLRRKSTPSRLTGLEFVRLWGAGGHFLNFITNLARRADLLAVGGYPEMEQGDDDLLALKLALRGSVAVSGGAVFYNRWYEASAGLAASPWQLAADIKAWFEALDADPVLVAYARENPCPWAEIRQIMREKGWRTYRHRYRFMYRNRMSRMAWIRAGFAMPFIPDYYRWLIPYLLRTGLRRPAHG